MKPTPIASLSTRYLELAGLKFSNRLIFHTFVCVIRYSSKLLSYVLQELSLNFIVSNIKMDRSSIMLNRFIAGKIND